jgi:hypothetical protein
MTILRKKEDIYEPVRAAGISAKHPRQPAGFQELVLGDKRS